MSPSNIADNSERREVARSLIDMHSQWNRITAELSVKSDAAEVGTVATFACDIPTTDCAVTVYV